MEATIEEAIARTPDDGDRRLGCVSIRLADDATDLMQTEALITRQGPFANPQQSLPIPHGEDVCFALAPGAYSIVVKALGRLPHREMVLISPCEDARVVPDLSRRAESALTFADRLRKYGIDVESTSGRGILVPDGETTDLTSRSAQQESPHQVKLDSVDRVKEVLGVPDEMWPVGFARYGDIVRGENDARHALREYVYGNSRVVAHWQDRLNDLVREVLDPDFPVFAVETVTVGRCAVLKVGRSGLSCEILRMHPSARIKVVAGPVHIETGVFERL